MVTTVVSSRAAVSLREHFTHLRPYLVRMLRPKDSQLNDAGERHASIAVLCHEDAADLVMESMAGNPSHRLGVWASPLGGRKSQSNHNSGHTHRPCEKPMLMQAGPMRLS
jgi:hypothetical protein